MKMISLTKSQFDILDILIEENLPLTVEQLKNKTGYSSDTLVNNIRQLIELSAIKQMKITVYGKDIMEAYRAKRAIILAAGCGTRLRPLTVNTPKPLVRVHGVRIIDRQIDACLAAGIEEIYIVRGYLAEQFDLLLKKYPMLKFVDNPVYNETNNISSAMCVRNYFQNAYVFESDILINNPRLIKPYQYQSNYLGIYKENTDDWCFDVKDGIITEQKIGGVHCYQEIGISYWSQEDGKRLPKDILKAYEMPDGKDIFWDESVFKVFRNQYQVAVRDCRQEDIVEIDDFEELKKIDPIYNS